LSFSSLILSSCSVHGRKRPVRSCGVVDWIGRPLISPTPSPGHRQVTVFCSPRLPCGRRAKSIFEERGRSIRRKRQWSSVIERERTRQKTVAHKSVECICHNDLSGCVHQCSKKSWRASFSETSLRASGFKSLKLSFGSEHPKLCFLLPGFYNNSKRVPVSNPCL